MTLRRICSISSSTFTKPSRFSFLRASTSLVRSSWLGRETSRKKSQHRPYSTIRILPAAHLDVHASCARVDAFNEPIAAVYLGSRFEPRYPHALRGLRIERLRNAAEEHPELLEGLGAIAPRGLVDGRIVQAERGRIADGAFDCATWREFDRCAGSRWTRWRRVGSGHGVPGSAVAAWVARVCRVRVGSGTYYRGPSCRTFELQPFRDCSPRVSRLLPSSASPRRRLSPLQRRKRIARRHRLPQSRAD